MPFDVEMSYRSGGLRSGTKSAVDGDVEVESGKESADLEVCRYLFTVDRSVRSTSWPSKQRPPDLHDRHNLANQADSVGLL